MKLQRQIDDEITLSDADIRKVFGIHPKAVVMGIERKWDEFQRRNITTVTARRFVHKQKAL